MSAVESKDVYQQEGYKDRKDYLNGLAENFGVSRKKVFLLASLLGPSEDFDGLISELEDLSSM